MHPYAASPTVFLVQSRLFSPGYAGIGRWVLFDAATRRAFSAIGRGAVPDVVRIMTRASAGATHVELRAAAPWVSLDQLTRLQEAELLRHADEEPRDPASRTFARWYQWATFDYPFHDYSVPGWQDEERALLDHYTRLWPPPSSLAERRGAFRPLPKRDLADVPTPGGRGSLDTASLGWVLQHSFGPTGEIETDHVTCIRRTSPSGGARHPAEVTIELPEGTDEFPPGSYVYDVARHGLVSASEATPVLSSCSSAHFIVRVRVDRAMWRYRDLRALRPVLLDVGHIVETLALLLDQVGQPTTLASPTLTQDTDFAWLEEPPVAVLVVNGAASAPEGRGVDSDITEAEELLTNPAAVLHFSDGHLFGRTVWPDNQEEALDENDFLIIEHCVPSTRGDRLTTTDGILDAVPGATPERVRDLARTRLLLPSSTAQPFYQAARLWVRHDWYLSMLLHLECLSWARRSPARSGLQARTDYIENLRALATRRTTRVFQNELLPWELVDRLLTRALDGLCDDTAVRWWRIFVGPLAVTDLPAQVHEWTSDELKPLHEPVTRQLVRDLTTGQEPAGSGSCVVWIITGLDVDDPASYELGLIELGRLGQRMCLVATDLSLGAFLTPAIKDTATLAYLGVDQDPATAAYVFSIGLPRSRT